MRVLRACVMLAMVLAVARPAPAVVVLAAPSNEFLEFFATPVTATPRGGPLYLVNTDHVQHSVVSFAVRPAGDAPWCGSFDPGYCPLFWSEPVLSAATPVQGLADAPTGEYPFYCGVHPTMRGTLLIE